MKNYLISFLVAAIVSVAIGAITIPLLKKLKFGQNILSYVSEHDYKSGTPTIGVQTLVNALVVTGSIPPTGLPLPLVSAGNTSLIVFLFSFGVLYNVSRNTTDG